MTTPPVPCQRCGANWPCHNPACPGRKDDAAKLRFDLIPVSALKALGQVLTYGAQKYAPDNWRHVENAPARYRAALFRHLVAYLDGEKVDPESGIHHLAHIMANASFLLELDP